MQVCAFDISSKQRRPRRRARRTHRDAVHVDDGPIVILLRASHNHLMRTSRTVHTYSSDRSAADRMSMGALTPSSPAAVHETQPNVRPSPAYLAKFPPAALDDESDSPLCFAFVYETCANAVAIMSCVSVWLIRLDFNDASCEMYTIHHKNVQILQRSI